MSYRRDTPFLVKDYINGRYFIFTALYSFSHFMIAGVSYISTSSYLLLFTLGGIGLLSLLLSIGHTYDYYHGANIESFYVAIPLVLSFFIGTIATCFYLLGAPLIILPWLMSLDWISVIFYTYAVLKDFANGQHARVNYYTGNYERFESDILR